MTSDVRFHVDASAEYEAAFEWYYLRSEFVASRFSQEIEHAIQMILDGPNRWPVAALGTRKVLLRQFPFAIIYRETSSGIQVVAVAHGHRKPGYWKLRS